MNEGVAFTTPAVSLCTLTIHRIGVKIKRFLNFGPAFQTFFSQFFLFIDFTAEFQQSQIPQNSQTPMQPGADAEDDEKNDHQRLFRQKELQNRKHQDEQDQRRNGNSCISEAANGSISMR